MENTAFTSPKIEDVVRQSKERFEAIGSDMNFQKEATFALQVVQKSPDLQQVLVQAPETLKNAIINVASTGLSLNPILKFAYLIARNVKQKDGSYRKEAVLDVSYMGLIQLITVTGGARNAYAYLVHEGDEFEVIKGTNPSLMHKPLRNNSSKKIEGVYAVVVLPDGTVQFDDMYIDELNDIKARSEAGKRDFGPWKSDFGEMCRKTILKRLCKYIPKNSRMLNALEAIQIDNDNNGIDFQEEQKRQVLAKRNNAIKSIVSNITKQPEIAAPVTEPVKEESSMSPEEAFKLIEEQAGNMNTVEELKVYEEQLELESVNEPNKRKIQDIIINRLNQIKSKK